MHPRDADHDVLGEQRTTEPNLGHVYLMVKRLSSSTSQILCAEEVPNFVHFIPTVVINFGVANLSNAMSCTILCSSVLRGPRGKIRITSPKSAQSRARFASHPAKPAPSSCCPHRPSRQCGSAGRIGGCRRGPSCRGPSRQGAPRRSTRDRAWWAGPAARSRGGGWAARRRRG